MTHSENHQPPMPDAPCLDAQDVAEILGVSLRTIDRLRQSGSLTFRRVGHQIRFVPQDVADYLDRSRVSAVS
jgi:excisionase family DNA binding protein